MSAQAFIDHLKAGNTADAVASIKSTLSAMAASHVSDLSGLAQSYGFELKESKEDDKSGEDDDKSDDDKSGDTKDQDTASGDDPNKDKKTDAA